VGKKVIAYIVVVFISICAIFSFDVLGNSHIKIFVNGEEVVGDVLLINDRTFLPVRAISEALGADVQWDAKLGLPSNAGLTITKVKEDSSAKENGLVEGDVILSVNGIKVNNLVDYNETMKNYLPGEQVTVKVNRNGVITDFIITLGN
jgi:membrane-associated protease RseP (regulator of RpoE activity)